jgi:hypothetical protein
MATFGSRSGFSEKLSLPLMVLAFLFVGGFLYWLSITAEPTEVVIVEEETRTGSGASAILDVVDFLGDPGQYAGQVVEVNGGKVVSRLGSQAFWIEGPNAPFLIKMDSALVEAGTTVLIEQGVTVVGTVHTLVDSMVVAWEAAGAITAMDRPVVEFSLGSPFLEASTVEIRPPGGGSGG